jgi:hypothetical protein
MSKKVMQGSLLNQVKDETVKRLKDENADLDENTPDQSFHEIIELIVKRSRLELMVNNILMNMQEEVPGTNQCTGSSYSSKLQCMLETYLSEERVVDDVIAYWLDRAKETTCAPLSELALDG